MMLPRRIPRAERLRNSLFHSFFLLPHTFLGNPFIASEKAHSSQTRYSGPAEETSRYFDLPDTGRKLTWRVVSNERFEVSVGTCPDDPVDKHLRYAVLRRHAKQAAWTNRLTFDVPTRIRSNP